LGSAEIHCSRLARLARLAGLNDDVESRARARVGSTLDEKWTLERLLGVGGMAAVYAGRHRNGARGAIKLLHPDLARHRDVRERFRREGYAANRVEHAGAVRVLDDDVVAHGPAAGTAYLVMELLEGLSLQDRLEAGPPIGELEFLQIASQVLEVLRAAHARGVVHRDLKPENLFLVRPDAVAAAGASLKVLDFGLARLLDGQAITTYGLALGTPSFMSPEQAAGRLDEIDGRTDLFALAATGFRLRTGRRIHEAANVVELVQKMASLPAPPLRAVVPEVSEPFARVIDRALAFRRDDRYGDAAAMQLDVERAMAELEAGTGRTERAVLRGPAGSLDVRGHSTTLEVSRGDLEPTVPRHVPRARGRRSILPWITLVAFAAIGGRLALDARAPAAASLKGGAPSRVTVDAGGLEATLPALPAWDAGPAAADSGTPRSASSSVPGAVAPSARPRSPPKPTPSAAPAPKARPKTR
jgi:serine/threonine-protein kinase